MAQHFINKKTDSTVLIANSGDTWILGKNGSIVDPVAYDLLTAIGPAFPAGFDNTTIDIRGAINLDGLSSIGVLTSGKDNKVLIAETGKVDAFLYGINATGTGGTLSIVNDGKITADGWGISSNAVEDSATIRNNGVISADYGISAAGSGSTVINKGVITADDTGIEAGAHAMDNDPLSASNAVKITNTGTITGGDFSIAADDVAVHVLNKGVLNGDVKLGVGDDVFNTAKGTLNGEIWGGDGDDVFILSSTKYVIHELAGEGVDTVGIASTYKLVDNIENGVLLGAGDFRLFGNGLDNVLTGNAGANRIGGLAGMDTLNGGKGNDILTGGTDADMFVFAKGGGVDRIEDFENGVDHITFRNLGPDFDFSDLQIHQNGINTTITFDNGDKLVFAATAASELTADDFFFL